MVTEDDPFIRLYEIPAILVDLARRGPPVIEHERAGSDPLGIKSVADGVAAKGSQQNVGGANWLIALESQARVRASAHGDDCEPKEDGESFLHVTGA
jgi:hypothetical protein